MTNVEIKIQATAQDRDAILAMAARITRNSFDMMAVVANAVPLAEWIEAAIGDTDRGVRMAALRRQENAAIKNPGFWEDRPDQFLDDARTLYAFLYPAGASA